MSELTVVDGDGVPQFIWLQERDDTCGPACVYMVERIARQACIVGGEDRIRLITSLLPQGYQDGKGTQSYKALASVMTRIGMPAAATKVSNMADFVSGAMFPFIARVGWANGGGHFVVAVKTSGKGALVCLDPWYGLVEPNLATLPAYTIGRNDRDKKCLVTAIGGTLSGHVVFQNASA